MILLITLRASKHLRMKHLRELHNSEKQISASLLATLNEGKAIALSIKKSAKLKEHITHEPAVLICLEGKALFGDELENNYLLGPGNYVNIPENVVHWVEGVEDASLVLIK